MDANLTAKGLLFVPVSGGDWQQTMRYQADSWCGIHQTYQGAYTT